ncbi:MAG: helix-hairpin-helix domain-containing protein [Candidatus Thermoplasmatota archaeon]
MLITIIDGYVDEPSCLGVPPYISPYPRYLCGAIKETGNEALYVTIDELRTRKKLPQKSKILVIIAGTTVPGNYLRGKPISVNEIARISSAYSGIKILGGPLGRFWKCEEFCRDVSKISDNFDWIAKKDLDATVFDYLNGNGFNDRERDMKEGERWLMKGAEVISKHPDFPEPLIVEIETYRGCVRYLTGGCSFCPDVLYGQPIFREVKNIVKEIEKLDSIGARNYRLGGASCIFSYFADGVGEVERPKPRAQVIEKLLIGIREKAKNLKVLHTDNANPAIIAEHSDESKKIAKAIVKYCTSGNTLAFGMESADDVVIKANNLNALPHEVLKAIEIINSVGSSMGDNGLPHLLPGINILFGLKSERKETYEINYRFLKEIVDKGLLLRRINIRQVSSIRAKFAKPIRKLFVKFKIKVRKDIDNFLLKKIVPYNRVLKEVYLEKIIGNVTYGRQIGSYPLLVGIPYRTNINRFVDTIIIGHGYRSVTGIEYPIDINNASFSAISAIPKIGKKRAARIIINRPFSSLEEIKNVLDERELLKIIQNYIVF